MIVTDKWEDLPLLHYRAILADCPWNFENWSEAGNGKNAKSHYSCMTIDQLATMPVGHLAHKDCVLFMWATWPLLPRQLDLMAAWGFRYVTGGAWAKQSPGGRTWSFGTGYVLRGTTEPFLVGTMGAPDTKGGRHLRNLIVAERREHSRKPDEIYAYMEQLCPGPRLELFARNTRKNWDSFGNEVGKFGGAA